MADETFMLCPDLDTYADLEHSKLTVEAEIPGVEKKDITIRMHEDSLSLYAPRENENVAYAASVSFCCPVKPKEAKAKYENGLLRVEVPFKFKPEDAVKVPVE
ncbi:MAG: Hsp20/alpha crystallin family protein [Methanotrichaceae archaeon]